MEQFLLQLLLLAFCNSLLIIGLYESAQYKLRNGIDEKFYLQYKDNCERNYPGGIFEHEMFLSQIAIRIVARIGKFWSKPIITCAVCMSSLHSTYIYWSAYYLFMPHDLTHVFAYLFYIPLLAGITTVIVNLIYRD